MYTPLKLAWLNLEIQQAPRIVNGDTTKSYTWQWIVSIQVRRSHLCGGTIINNEYILTGNGLILVKFKKQISTILITFRNLINLENKTFWKCKFFSKLFRSYQNYPIFYEMKIEFSRTESTLFWTKIFGIARNNFCYVSNLSRALLC
jgi:hypothetical protein